MNESEILKGIINSDIRAYEQLFVRFYGIIKGFLIKMNIRVEHAEDIAQDIFMKVWINRQSLDADKSIKALIYKMAKNAALNQLKLDQRHKKEDLDMETPGGYLPDLIVEYEEAKTHMTKIINNMPPMRRKVFSLSRLQHMPNKDIALMLNISVRTVEKHIELAMRDISQNMTN